MQDRKHITRKFQIVILLLVQIFFRANGQDLHYSQFYNSPQNINPAQTGLFNGDHRFTLSFRDQWRFVPVPWFTFSAAYDRKLYVMKSDKHFLGVGGIINHDRQGDGNLNLTSLNINGAYHRIFSQNHIVSGGIALGFASRGFNSQTLTWGNQWNGDTFDPSLGSGEGFSNFERVNFFESGAGLNYRYQKSSRTFADLGTALLHLVKPNTSFFNSQAANLPQRFTLSLVGQVKVMEKMDIQLHGLYQTQGKYIETIVGGLGKIYVNQQRGKETQLHIGLGYRTSGSIIPTLALQYNNIYGSFSYDVDRTNFNSTLKTNRGGPELHLRYFIANVKSLKVAKVCPIY